MIKSIWVISKYSSNHGKYLDLNSFRHSFSAKLRQITTLFRSLLYASSRSFSVSSSSLKIELTYCVYYARICLISLPQWANIDVISSVNSLIFSWFPSEWSSEKSSFSVKWSLCSDFKLDIRPLILKRAIQQQMEVMQIKRLT